MGFFVLLGFVAYVVLATFVVNAIEKYSGNKIAKYAGIAIFVLIPTWDIVPGKLYFNHLCETEAGVKVFKTVKVGQSYFRPDGRPDDKKLAERYLQLNTFERGFSSLFHIARSESVIKDNQTGEILGSAKNFSHKGGWLTAFVLPDAAGNACPAYPYLGMHGALLREVFRPNYESISGGH